MGKGRDPSERDWMTRAILVGAATIPGTAAVWEVIARDASARALISFGLGAIGVAVFALVLRRTVWVEESLRRDSPAESQTRGRRLSASAAATALLMVALGILITGTRRSDDRADGASSSTPDRAGDSTALHDADGPSMSTLTTLDGVPLDSAQASVAPSPLGALAIDVVPTTQATIGDVVEPGALSIKLDGNGCPNDSGAFRFNLEGHYARLVATIALDDSVPADTYAFVTIEADGRSIESDTVTTGRPLTVDEVVTSIAEIRIVAEVRSHQVDTCGTGAVALTVTHASVY